MRTPLPPIMGRAVSDRRGQLDESSVADYFSSAKSIWDEKQGVRVVKLFSGDWHASADREVMLATILGSCVSACVRDPVTKIGGMNHFLLPGMHTTLCSTEGGRYGVHAMETLINHILSHGGRKERLEVKVFGGANVLNNSTRIGSQNALFIRHYLEKERIPIHSEDLEGDWPRRVHYYPVSGKVMVRTLRRQEDLQVVEVEKRYNQSLSGNGFDGSIELFLEHP